MAQMPQKRTTSKKPSAGKNTGRHSTKSTLKKRTKQRAIKKNISSNTNLLTALTGLLLVCVILMTVYFFVIPAVNEEKQIAKIESKKEIVKENKENPKVLEQFSKSARSKNKIEKQKEIETIPEKKKTVIFKTEEKKHQQEDSIKRKQKKTKQDRSGLKMTTKKSVEKKITKPVEKNTRTESETVVALNKTELAPPIHELPSLPSKGNLIFVFDDAGHNLDQLEYFLKLPFPCAIAVLPRLPNSKEAAKRIRDAGKEVMLHQPMQAINLNINPGDGAIKPKMSADEIKNTVIANIEEICPIAGMNNHEGSLITADEFSMKIVLQVCIEKNIFFLDSRTSAKTVVPKVARHLNFPIWERAIFIDNDKNVIAMEKQIIKGLTVAEQTGEAVLIGHVFTVELAKLLEKMYPKLKENGYSFTTISKLKK